MLGRASSCFLLLLTAALAGCAGGPDKDDGKTDPAPMGPPTGARVVMLGAGGVRTIVNYTETLADGTPWPVGTMRYVGEESFEPTLGVDQAGNIFASTFAGSLGAQKLITRSKDKGMTWMDVTPQLGPTTFPQQSNDPYVYVDYDTGRVFLSDLQALVCSTLSFSDNQGDSWTNNPIGCGQPFGVHDHQTVFSAKPKVATPVGYSKIVYYCVNRVADSTCASSLNGGLTFGPLRPVVYPGVEPTDPNAGLCGGLHAHGAAGPDGTIYLPKGQCGKPMVAISKDDGVTWTVSLISDKIPSIDHEVAFAVDDGGIAYAFWINWKSGSTGDNLAYLAVSPDGGAHWNEPISVAPPGVNFTQFPSVAAGEKGRVAMVYMGSEKAKSGSWEKGTWNGYLTVITDAASATPTISTVTVNDPADPLARGQCGGRCSGVGDFIDVVVDKEGRPWGIFVDVCNDDCAAPDGSGNSGAQGVVGTLAEGPTMRGTLAGLVAIGRNATQPGG